MTIADIITKILPYVTKWLAKDEPCQVIPIRPDVAIPQPVSQSVAINWADPKSQITRHFSVGEMITLHAWNRLATLEDGLTDQVKEDLKVLCQKLEDVSHILGCPINVHCGFRSVKYNEEILHSLPKDVHSMGMAIDLDCLPAKTCDQVKEILLPKLETLGLRMEDNGVGASWIHLDIHPIINARFFKV